MYVTELNCVTSLGENIDDVWSNIIKKKSGLEKYITDDFDCFLSRIDEKKYSNKNESKPYILSNVSSGILLDKIFKKNEFIKTILIYCTGFNYFNSENSRPTKYIDAFPNIIPSKLLENYDVDITVFTNLDACSSANNTISLVKNLLDSNAFSRAIVIATDCKTDNHHLLAFKKLGLLAKYNQEGLYVFDEKRSGTALGDGSACVVFENESSLKKTKNEILAEILGCGSYLSKSILKIPSDSLDIYKSMKKAIGQAGIKVSEISYINCHGNGVPMSDKGEINAIEKLYSTENKNIYINSFKPYIGHTTAASSLIDLCLIIKSMKGSYLPQNLHFKKHENELNNVSFSSQVQNPKITTVISNSIGIGGLNASIVIKNKTN